MQDRILRGFNSAAAVHPAFVLARANLATGPAREAVTDSARALIQFPNYRPAYELFFQAAEKLNVDVSALRGQVEAELANPDTSGTFIYRYALVDKCTKLARDLLRD
jgi:hypothetical protein